MCWSIWRDRIAENSSAKLSMPRLRLGDVALHLVVGDERRNGGEEADRGGEQRLRDAGRDDGERGVLRGRDRAERRHDAPDRAEQADEGAGRRHGGEHEQIGFEPLDLARDGDVEHLLDARLQAHEGGAGARLEGALPFPHGGDEQRRHAGRAAARRACRRAPRANGPTRSISSKRSIARRMRANSSVLSMMIAQHQTEAASSPTMTILTTICAPQNMLQIVMSAAGAARGLAAISAGFMICP